MNFFKILFLAGIGVAAYFLFFRKSANQKALDAHFKELEQLGRIGSASNTARIAATPPVSMFGTLPMTDLILVPTAPQIGELDLTGDFLPTLDGSTRKAPWSDFLIWN